MIRKCLTINPNRNKEEIRSYQELLINKIYSGVEIFFPYQKSIEEREIYISSVKEYLNIKDLEMVCHLPYGADNNLASLKNIDIIMKRYKEAIDFAHLFNIQKLTLHPGFNDETMERNKAILLASKNIKELCQYAKKYGMYIMLENLISESELMRTPEEYFELKTLVNEDNLGIIFDVAHYYASNYCRNIDDIKRFINMVKDDLMHLHISDNDGKRDMHARIGVGTIDFKEYFKELQKIGYKGLYSSEVLFNTVDDLKNTACDMDSMAKK